MMVRPIRRNHNPNSVNREALMLILKALILLLSSYYTNTAQTFTMKLTPLNETAIHVNLTLPNNSKAQEMTDMFKIRLKYQPSVANICPLNSDKPLDIESKCNSSVEWFGYYDNAIDSNSQVFNQLCLPKIILLNLDTYISYTLTDLLSNVIYIIRTSVVLSGDYNCEADYVETCTITNDIGPPLYPPQTDLSSYQILGNPSGIHELTLFWRPIPSILAGTSLTKYQLKCHDATNSSIIKLEKSDLDCLSGSLNVSLDLKYSHNCSIFAHNSHGISSRNSIIYIPRKSRIYDENLDIQVSVVQPNKYILRWINLNNTLSSLYPMMSLDDGYYTIYWCQPLPGEYTCPSIEGMKKTRKNPEEIIINGLTSSFTLFGVSYTLPRWNYSSGISWTNDCIFGRTKSPYCDITNIQSDSLGKQLIVNWRVKCDPLRAMMVNIYFETCELEEYFCNDKTFQDMSRYNLSLEGKKECIITNTSINSDNFHIEKLTPGYIYRLRTRVEFGDKTFSNFTEPRLVRTNKPQCYHLSTPENIFPSLASLTASFMIGICIFTWIYRQYTKFKKTTNSLTKVLDDKLEIMSSVDSFDLKYLINRSSSHTQNSFTSNPTSTGSIESSGEPSTAICVSDYLPVDQTDIRYLEVMNEEKGMSESIDCSDTLETALDNQYQCCSFDASHSGSTSNISKHSLDVDCEGLSLDSHSSFLHQILQPDPLHDPPEKKFTYLLKEFDQPELSNFIK